MTERLKWTELNMKSKGSTDTLFNWEGDVLKMDISNILQLQKNIFIISSPD